MGIFGPSKKDQEKLFDQVKALRDTTMNSIMAQLSRHIAIYPSYDIAQNSERYATTDDVYSIVRMLATTAAMVPVRPYMVKDEKAAKELRRKMQPHTMPMETKVLMQKALVELPESDKLEQLLELPSDQFSGKFEFYEALYSYLLLDGEAFLLKERPDTGVNAGKIIGLLLMTPQNIILKVTDTLPRRIVGFDYRENGQIVYENLSTDDVIHIKYFNPTCSNNGDNLRGLSPIKVLAKRLTQYDSNLDTEVAQMQNGGVSKVVYDETPYDNNAVEIMGARKSNFYKFLKDKANAGAPFFASGKMGVLDIGSTLADMKLIESAAITFKKLCNVFGTSDQLFNSNDTAGSENSVEAMIKRTYTNTILPNVYRVRDAYIKGLLPEFKGKYEIREDISEIAELQPNSKQMAEWLNTAWWVTPNQKLEMMRFEKNANPLFDEPLIPTGLQPLSDLSMIPDLPIPTPNGN